MTNCTFCSQAIEAGTGKLYIRRDGTMLHFCSAKCKRNQVDLGRVNRHVGWTQAYAEHKGDRQAGTTAAKPKPKAAKPAPAAAGKTAPTAKPAAAAKAPAK
jgi:large subunit ribosomal protein L24e